MQTPTFALPVAASEAAGGAAAGGQNAGSTHNSRSLHKVTTGNHFHNLVLLHSHITASHGIYLHVCSMVSVCIITVWKIIRNGTSSQDSGRFFVHSSQLILLCTTFFLLSSTKSVENATYIQIPCQKSINPFKMVTTSFCSCNKFLCTENARFFPGVLHKTYISGKNRAFFSFFTFLCVRGGSGWG